MEQAREVYKNADNAEITLLDKSTQRINILADHDQLLRTFNNLFKNAIEAIDGYEQCYVTVILFNDKSHAFVEVKDNGKGIPLSLHDKIFVPNFTTKTSGTGLGLAFVKQAIENAGGDISFTSVPDVGTTFYLSFPLA